MEACSRAHPKLTVAGAWVPMASTKRMLQAKVRFIRGHDVHVKLVLTHPSLVRGNQYMQLWSEIPNFLIKEKQNSQNDPINNWE